MMPKSAITAINSFANIVNNHEKTISHSILNGIHMNGYIGIHLIKVIRSHKDLYKIADHE